MRTQPGPRTLQDSPFSTHRQRRSIRNWDEAANTTVAMLRTEAGRNPYDRGLSDLVGELSTRSDMLRNRRLQRRTRQPFPGRADPPRQLGRDTG